MLYFVQLSLSLHHFRFWWLIINLSCEVFMASDFHHCATSSNSFCLPSRYLHGFKCLLSLGLCCSSFSQGLPRFLWKLSIFFLWYCLLVCVSVCAYTQHLWLYVHIFIHLQIPFQVRLEEIYQWMSISNVFTCGC